MIKNLKSLKNIKLPNTQNKASLAFTVSFEELS